MQAAADAAQGCWLPEQPQPTRSELRITPCGHRPVVWPDGVTAAMNRAEGYEVVACPAARASIGTT
ncbi:hypothetical protein [Sphaerotilus microaerophilus]|uniref:Uncharacterized protein n=1 Tax=Sphaerotilus microaerophilus TaxID=2914710 RepID=A0ABN6PNR8_9BURK|nr:hypothetical protein [Sphaerotilus sp. FB-5]BDI05659.1 hypothetical protein CATMQ487_26290 [Sphaerotilus sp. FB-5]